MKLSVVVNTCSLGPRSETVTGSHTNTPHALRAYALRHFILPHYVRHADEVIVVGEYSGGEGYSYIHCPSRHFSAVDALAQRHEGFGAAKNDWIAFVHDDHWLDLTHSDHLHWRSADIWVPTRWKRAQNGEIRPEINGMEQNPPYIGGHCAVYSRKTLESAPWGDVPRVWTWDVEHTAQLCSSGVVTVKETDVMRVWDVEA